MKNIKFLAICAAFLFAGAAQSATVDFVEAQVHLVDQPDAIEMAWNAEKDMVWVKYNVEWANYEAKLHQTGFHTSRAYRAYIDDPDMGDCQVYDHGGILYSPDREEKSYFYFWLSGPSCKSRMDDLKSYLPAFAYYGVPFVQPSSDSANALHVLFLSRWD